MSKELGDDLGLLYEANALKQNKIKQFLLSQGILASEITANAPNVVDLKAEQYSKQKGYRYNITSVITVTSKQVDKVRALIARQGELLRRGVAIINGGYENPVTYDLEGFASLKPKIMEEAIANAEKTAAQFAKNSHSTLDKIITADQGLFSIDNRDTNTPCIKKVRVVTTITYSLKD